MLLDAVIAGAILGYTNISYVTWIQRRIPRNLMGRVMSLMMFGSVALIPLSMAVSGALVKISLEAVLMGGGLGMAALALLGLLSRSVRAMGLEPPLSEDEPTDDAAPLPTNPEAVATA
jgi:hypothetical protein